MSLKTPNLKVFVVIIAYNAEKTIRNVVEDIPREWVDKVVISDDNSIDKTYDVSMAISDVEVIKNKKNLQNIF